MAETETCAVCRGKGKILDGGIVPCPPCLGTGQQAIVTKDEAMHVLYHLGKPGGLPGGGFIHSLLRTIQQADQANRQLLRKAYPGYVAAMNDWTVEDLQNRVKEEAA
jgi:hypothetical protein